MLPASVPICVADACRKVIVRKLYPSEEEREQYESVKAAVLQQREARHFSLCGLPVRPPALVATQHAFVLDTVLVSLYDKECHRFLHTLDNRDPHLP